MTAGFLDPLVLRDLGQGKRWTLARPLRYQSALYAGHYVVPRRFETDLASIPQFAHSLFPKSGRHNRAAVLHDACYAGVTATLDGTPQHVVKPVADRLFLEAMRADGVGAVRARLMYWAVSAFGDPKQREAEEIVRQALKDMMEEV